MNKVPYDIIQEGKVFEHFELFFYALERKISIQITL